MKRKIIIALLCLVCALIFADLIFDIKDFSLRSAQSFEISAEILWDEAVANELKAKQTYDGNAIVVTGVVAEKAASFMGKPCIVLENGADSIPDGIFCYMQTSEMLSECDIGNEITVAGICSFGVTFAGENMPYIFLDDCVIR